MIFASQREMEPLMPVMHGRVKAVSGLFQPGLDHGFLVVSKEALRRGEEGNGNALLHECAHSFFKRQGLSLPTWLDEGLAEYLSSMQFLSDGVVLGGPIKRRTECLRRERALLPLGELLAADHASSDYVEGSRQPLFYAESWLLVDTLVGLQEGSPAERLAALLALCNEGVDTKSALERLAGRQMASLETVLRRRAGESARPFFVGLAGFGGSSGMSVREAGATERETVLEDLKWRLSADASDGLALFDLAKKDPASPLPWEVLGALTAGLEHDRYKAETYWERAAELGSANPYVYVQLAKLRMKTATHCTSLDYRAPAAVADPIRAWLDQALRLDPGNAEAWETLAQLEAFSEQPRRDVLAKVRDRLQVGPPSSEALTAFAFYQWREGNLQSCREFLEKARALGSPRADVQRQMRRLREQLDSSAWLTSAVRPEAPAADSGWTSPSM